MLSTICTRQERQVSGANGGGARILARRILKVARQFGASAQQCWLRDPEKRRRGARVARDGRLDLGEQPGLRPLAHVGVGGAGTDEVLEESGPAGGRGGRADGETGRAARGGALELPAIRAVGQSQHLGASPGYAGGEPVGG